MKSILDDIFMLGIEGDTYQLLLNIAKKQNKSVSEVAAEALKEKIQREQQVAESKERKILCEG